MTSGEYGVCSTIIGTKKKRIRTKPYVFCLFDFDQHDIRFKTKTKITNMEHGIYQHYFDNDIRYRKNVRLDRYHI
jgi:hypothetical protein